MINKDSVETKCILWICVRFLKIFVLYSMSYSLCISLVAVG